MAVTNKNSEQFVLELYQGLHHLSEGDYPTLYFILMNSSFVFNPATHSTYAAISGSEIPTGGGYTRKTKQVNGITLALSNHVVVMTCGSPTWTATTGGIPAVSACCVINDNNVNKTVICCCEFGASYTTADTKQFQINYSSGLLKGTPNPA